MIISIARNVEIADSSITGPAAPAIPAIVHLLPNIFDPANINTTTRALISMSIRNVLTDLIMNHDLKAFMMADEWLTEDEFKQIETVFEQLEKNKGKNRIGITFYDNVSQEEKDIVLGKHLFRYDSPIANLRSQSSREMAEFAKDVKPNNMVIRKTGDVTIDNSLYKRYSGEMEVMLEDHDQDDRVNVVAHINDENDLYKLLYFRDGIEYIFEEQNDESNH